MAACAPQAPGAALSCAGVSLQLSRLARWSVFTGSSCFFSFWKTEDKNGKRGAHALPCSSACNDDERVNRKSVH